jgi:hypothetical protein
MYNTALRFYVFVSMFMRYLLQIYNGNALCGNNVCPQASSETKNR